MSAIRRFGAGLCAAVVAFSGQALASDIALSGTVVKPDATPLAGATVRLVQAGLTATTDAHGAWALGSTVGIRGVHSAPITNAANLRLENGRLQVRLDGRDVSGRGQSFVPANANLQAVMMARSQTTAPDTLVYAYNQKEFLRDTISAFDQSGIVREYDTTVNAKITYGYLKDARDGKRYRTVLIGTQTWMAENLSYRTDSSYCYNNDTAKCAVYGRLYKWAAALGLNDSCSTVSCASQVTTKMQGVCPSGWHVPSDAEWTTMQTFVGASKMIDGRNLKSASGWWPTDLGDNRTGTDVYGFRALPGGYFSRFSFDLVGAYGYWWSASEYDGVIARCKNMYYGFAYVLNDFHVKTGAFSLRCTKDN
jgi:uncharacterized protein (TIGR02145 family)